MDLISIFITGLFAGGLTCLAVQGGLLASSIAHQESDKLTDEAKRTGHVLPILSFLITRLIAYTLFGFMLGAIGSVVQLSLSLKVFLQLAVGIFMLGTAFNLLNLHPIFRYFVIQPPKSLTRLVKNQSKSSSVFGPALLGAMTVLIPCGATQAMMAYAISTGSALAGGLTLFVFILGTSPLFFILGYVLKKAGASMSLGFNKIAGAAIILVALYNISGAIALTGTKWTFENILNSINCTISFCDDSTLGNSAVGIKTTNEATVYLQQSGYKLEPTQINVKAGSKVKLNLVNQGGAGCIQAFTIPKLNLQKVIAIGDSDTIEFTAPKEPGPLTFMCSMGMFRGVINVVS